MSDKQKILNCFTDLDRAATSLYLNPGGNNHFVFLDHAIKILKETNKQYITNRLSEIKKEITQKTLPPVYLADKILTLGILMRQ